MKRLNLEKSLVDDAVARVLQMRVNRGLGFKMFRKKTFLPIMRPDNVQQRNLRDKKLRVA